MLVAARVNAHEFKMAIDLMKDVLTEATVTIEPTGKICIHALDPDKVCFVELSLWQFDLFESTTNETIRVGIFLPGLYKLIRYIKKDHVLEIKVDENHHILFTVKKDDEDSKTNWSVKINPIQISPYSPRAMEFDSTISSSISSAKLSTIIGSLSVISPVFDVIVPEKSPCVIFQSTGTLGTGQYELDINKDVTMYRRNGFFEGRFYSKFVDKFCKPAVNRPVDIVMGPNQPLEIGYSLENGRLSMKLMPLQKN